MNRYSLDYSTHSPRRRSSVRASNRRMQAAFRRSAVWLGCLLAGIALVGWFRLDLTNDQLQRANDQHRLQYDSLLASKLEADKHLRRLQSHVDSLRAQPAGSLKRNL